MVYAGANDGMLHAASWARRGYGTVCVHSPSAVFQGPNNTPQVDGLAELGNPSYSHHFYVDAKPNNYDIDLNHNNHTASSKPNSRTLLNVGLGKGGMSYYAIDETDPASMNTGVRGGRSGEMGIHRLHHGV